MAQIMNTDIYDITQMVSDVQKDMMQLDEDTLAVGMNGYLSSIQAMQIQNSIITASELGNEIFPSKAKFEKNIIAHAITQNITDINATPAKMSIMLGLTIQDLESLFIKDKFTLDAETRLFIGNIELHFQYDIIISRTLSINNTLLGFTLIKDFSFVEDSLNITSSFVSILLINVLLLVSLLYLSISSFFTILSFFFIHSNIFFNSLLPAYFSIIISNTLLLLEFTVCSCSIETTSNRANIVFSFPSFFSI